MLSTKYTHNNFSLENILNSTHHILPDTVLNFWFKELTPKQWWAKTDELDRIIESRFGDVHNAANRCELHSWRITAAGRLAEILVLDQFSRNIYRDNPKAFASDSLSLALAQTAVSAKADSELNDLQRSFLYMPYMHSESAKIHELAVRLFSQKGMEENLEFELSHKKIIDRFGRYPHRNAILGRQSTPEEIDFLKIPGSAF
jgi:uncharacterized protein (DUF924 family)